MFEKGWGPLGLDDGNHVLFLYAGMVLVKSCPSPVNPMGSQEIQVVREEKADLLLARINLQILRKSEGWNGLEKHSTYLTLPI